MIRPEILCFAWLLACTGCKKEAAPPARPATSAAAPVAAKAIAPAAKPANLPAAVSATAPPAEPPTLSVDMRSGEAMKAGLPTVGAPASFRAMLRNAKGPFVGKLDPLLGGKMLLVMGRADLGWFSVARADELSDSAHGTHDFRTIFPLSGLYRAWFVYSFAGQVQKQELAFSVKGPPSPGVELPPPQAAWQGEAGLAAQLKVEPEAPKTCEPFRLATAWTRSAKPLRMTAEPNAPTTWYLVLHSGLPEAVMGTAQPAASVLGGDIGTAATLQVARPGRYRVLAIATPPGAKAGTAEASVAATFVMDVTGPQVEGGCKK